jgi:hypothetical protein
MIMDVWCVCVHARRFISLCSTYFYPKLLREFFSCLVVGLCERDGLLIHMHVTWITVVRSCELGFHHLEKNLKNSSKPSHLLPSHVNNSRHKIFKATRMSDRVKLIVHHKGQRAEQFIAPQSKVDMFLSRVYFSREHHVALSVVP